MSKNPTISDQIDHYLTEIITKETPVQKRLRAETAKMPGAQMQITADQGAFLALLARISGAKKIIEIGTFTGYSALAMAAALPEGGKLIACDVDAEVTKIAGRYWQEAGVAEKIDLRIAPAMETLNRLLKNGEENSFDIAFIDADKAGYDDYYEACLKLIRPGGIIALDNMLWGGAVADSGEQDEQTKVLRALNLKIRDDQRLDSFSLLPLADGVMLARKKVPSP